MSMAAPNNHPARSYHSKLRWIVLVGLLDSIVIVNTKETPGTLHQHLLPAGMTAHAG